MLQGPMATVKVYKWYQEHPEGIRLIQIQRILILVAPIDALCGAKTNDRCRDERPFTEKMLSCKVCLFIFAYDPVASLP